MDARRPARARKAVTHYSDDNPSTFTVKRGKNDHASDPPQPPPTQHARAKRRDKRAAAGTAWARPNSGSSTSGSRRGASASLSAITATATATSANATSANATTATTNITSNRRSNSSQSTLEQQQQQLPQTPSHSSRRKRPREQQDTGPPPTMDEILAHRITIQPVFRPKGKGAQYTTGTGNGSSQVSNRKAQANANRNPLQQLAAHARWSWPTPKPHGWKTLPTADKEHILWSANEEPIALPPAAITAMTQHDPKSPYWMAGDAAGKVICYDLRIGRPVRTLLTKASHREAKRLMTSKTVISYPNLIAAIAAKKDTVVLWTAQELQAIRISTAVTIWTIDLELDCQEHEGGSTSTTSTANHRAQLTGAAAATQCLDIHATQNKILWQKPTAITPVGAGTTIAMTPTQLQPDAHVPMATLYLGVWGEDNDSSSVSSAAASSSSCDDSKTVLHWTPLAPHDTSHAVVWDVHDHNAVLQVATTYNDEVWELRRINIHNQRILDKTRLHNLTSNSNNSNGGTSGGYSSSSGGGATSHHLYTGCRIVQADDYLFLCTNRGIRCFDAQRFTFLTVYGETVALHGKTVGWQDCFWMPEPSWPHTVWQDAGGSTTGSTAKTTLASLAKAGGGTVALATGAMTQPTCLLSTRDEVARRHAVKNALAKDTTTNGSSCLPSNKVSIVSGNSGTSHSKPTSPTSAGHANALFSNMLLVGVPHPHRGPTELQSTLYVWKPGQVLPLTTLQAPAGGLLGLVASASPTHGWQLTCATAAHGQAWEFRARLQSDFSGNMYPIHYYVVNDNVEYIEDEDELDKNNAFNSAPSSVVASSSEDAEEDEEDVFLRRALQESLDNDVKINVLLEHDDEENNPFCSFVPAWPDSALRPMSSASGGKMSMTTTSTNQLQQQSPSRFRETAEPELFTGFPQLRLVHRARRDAREISNRRNGAMNNSNRTLQQDSSSMSSAPGGEISELDKIQKAKAKRSRATNIEVLLQASVDPKLRQEMMNLHKKWSDGKGSRFRAFDVLRSPKPKQDDGVEVSQLKDPPVPTRIASVFQTTAVASPPEGMNMKARASLALCAACAGRMVIHSCGKRAKPVDHEALAKAETERKAAEEAEKQRLKAEKRRAAEAKRREARKKKKEDEERKLREEELQKLEEERVAALHKTAGSLSVPQETESYHAYGPPPRKIPRYAELMSAPVTGRSENDYSFGYARERESVPHIAASATAVPQSNVGKETYARQNSSNVSEEGQSVYSSTSFTPAAVEPLFKPEETTPLEDTNTTYQSTGSVAPPSYTTSTAFSERSSAENDALAMLAGLADQSAKAPFLSGATTDSRHYDYSGAEDRRRVILDQFHHSLHPQMSSVGGHGSGAAGEGVATVTTAATNAVSSSVYDRRSSSVYGAYLYTGGTATSGQKTEADHPQQSSAANGSSSKGSLL